jgi:16S rRNA processing protein RimM
LNNPLINDGFISIGRITGSHGIQGAVRVCSYAESLSFFKTGLSLYLKRPDDSVSELYRVKWAAPHSRSVLLLFEGINSRVSADNLKGSELFIKKTDLPRLDEGVYYWNDIIGLLVFASDDTYIGRVESIIETGANDIYVVKNEKGKEVLIPAIESVVTDIDIDQKRMKVNLPEGL